MTLSAQAASAVLPAVFRISEPDYVRAMQLHARPTRSRLLMLAIMVLALVAVAVFGSSVWQGAAIGGLAGAVIVAGASYALLPWMARRHYRKYPSMHAAFSLALQDDGLRFSGQHAVGTLVWSNMIKWRRSDDFVLIYVMPRLFHIVPTSVSSQGFDLATLVARLTDHIGRPT